MLDNHLYMPGLCSYNHTHTQLDRIMKHSNHLNKERINHIKELDNKLKKQETSDTLTPAQQRRIQRQIKNFMDITKKQINKFLANHPRKLNWDWDQEEMKKRVT